MIAHLPRLLAFTTVTFLCYSTSTANAADLPPTMKVIEVRKIDPKPDPMSLDAEPVSYWYAGSGHGRMETARDDKQGIYQLVIMSDPNIWIIDLITKSGRHMVDHNPPLVVHFQIFGPSVPFEKGKPNLEFANEIEYFKYRNAKVTPGPTVNGRATKSYECTVGENKVILLTDKSDRPLRISFSNAESHETLEYLRYDEVPSDAAFFQVPAEIKLTDEESLQHPDESKK